jgi:hypothetical protein
MMEEFNQNIVGKIAVISEFHRTLQPRSLKAFRSWSYRTDSSVPTTRLLRFSNFAFLYK